jgi:ankyrin repeat protein
MPKQSTKSKGKSKGTKVEAAVDGADKDFDDMLAELRAADVTAEAATSGGRSTSNSNSSSSTSTTSSNTIKRASAATAVKVSEEALVRACYRGDISQLQRWARLGIRITSSGPLCEAVMESKYDVVMCLVLELGADVNQARDNGNSMTSLFIATRLCNLRMVKLLAKLKADVNRTDTEGRTPLFVAAAMGDLAVVRCLVKELSADVDRTDNAGLSPLHLAAQQGKLEVVQCLVEELGADVNVGVQDHGSTPLMTAAINMEHKIARYLLKHGADPQATYCGLTTAANFSQFINAPAEETAYLEARTHCANPGCANAGLKKCERCLQAYFCGNACIRAHWPAHKAECTAAAAKLKAARGTSSTSPSMPSPP